ncbi:MAG: DsrE family protein [Cyclobacteriaceae bacterium]|nr:DsrE family protein [Cyclobacteriaceae bacterium]
MRNICIVFLMCFAFISKAQTMVNPVIKNYGGIYDVPNAVEKPDPSLEYKIVVDLAMGSDKPNEVNFGLNNIARMINLHVVGGVPREKLHIIVAIHNEASYSIMSNEAYRTKYKTDNPNLALYDALSDAGVQFFICGQSIINRKIDPEKISDRVKIATSMLTVFTTYQLKGYAALKF